MRRGTIIAVERVIFGDQSRDLLRLEWPTDVGAAEEHRGLDLEALAPYLRLRMPGDGDLGGGGDPGAAGAERVLEAGRAIYERLSSHPGILAALDRAAGAQGGQRAPIFIDCKVDDAEALPWEALHHPEEGFLALDDRWPIVRLTGRRSGEEPAVQAVRLPLKVAVVLAAAERDPRPEWTALKEALDECGLPCEVRLWTSHGELLDAVRAEGDEGVRGDWVPTEPSELTDEVRAFAPDLLHIFSHGTTTYDSPYLEVATRATAELGQDPHYLNERDLLKACAEKTLMVVLNACQGAVPAVNTHSLAYGLVQAGIPAAVGMRESIDAADAHLFTGHAWTEILGCVQEQLPEGQAAELDWSAILRRSRASLCARHGGPPAEAAKAHGEWTLPVLYLRHDPLRVQRFGAGADPDDSAYLVGLLSGLRDKRAGLHPETPPEKVAELDRAIAMVEAALRGGTDGDGVDGGARAGEPVPAAGA